MIFPSQQCMAIYVLAVPHCAYMHATHRERERENRRDMFRRHIAHSTTYRHTCMHKYNVYIFFRTKTCMSEMMDRAYWREYIHGVCVVINYIDVKNNNMKEA